MEQLKELLEEIKKRQDYLETEEAQNRYKQFSIVARRLELDLIALRLQQMILNEMTNKSVDK